MKVTYVDVSRNTTCTYTCRYTDVDINKDKDTNR